MDAESLTKLVQDNLPDLNAAALEAIKGRIKQEIGWQIPQPVQAELSRFMAEEVAPEVAKMLAAEKGAILEGVRQATAGIGKALADQMLVNATKVLTDYSGRELIAKLVGGR